MKRIINKLIASNDYLLTFILLSIATGLAFLFFHSTPNASANISLLYILATILTARYTAGYRFGIFAALFSVVCINYLFTYPFFKLNFTLTGYPVTFIGLLAISIITSATTTRLKQQAAIIAERERTVEEAKRESIRANLLRAISHDLRTPLTSMIGASSSYLEEEELLSSEEKRQLVANINNDANWLLHMVENLLSVTRIQDNQQTVHKEPELVEEVVAEATQRLKKRLPDARIIVHAPEDMILLPMDALLIEQVLINLLENAILHSGSTVPPELFITQDNQSVTFSVIDYGHGLDESQLEDLFQGTYNSSDSSDTHKGMGIGLSICKTIIEAHQGIIEAHNHTNGAVFSFTLPES